MTRQDKNAQVPAAVWTVGWLNTRQAGHQIPSSCLVCKKRSFKFTILKSAQMADKAPVGNMTISVQLTVGSYHSKSHILSLLSQFQIWG